MSHSINNRILRVDLTEGRTWTEAPGMEFYRKYVGGRMFIAHYLLKELPQGADPLGPENMLIFAAGPVTGTPVPGNARHSVGAKSPMSGLYGESEAGGYWGAELKSAGWDGIIFTGKAEKPVYLWIKDDAVEIRDAAHLWGKITGDVEAELREELGDNRVRVTQIGPAGENLVRFACVVNDLNEFAGRAGMGAVMGSKNLKAIAVRGSTRPQPADMEPLKRTAQWVARDTFAEGQPHYIFHEYGTGAMVKSKQLEGHVISHNFRDGVLEGAENSDAISIKENVTERMDGCYSCSVNCKKRVRIETAKMTVDPKYGGPEYETLAAIGSNLGVTDIMAVCKSAEMVNYLGLDSISAGSVLAWAMEMVEMGVISPEDLGGEELTFGRGADVLRWIEMIAYRKGFGDVLAEGATHAARKIGQDSGKYVMAVKGIDLGMHDPRAMEVMRRQFAVAPVGGDHCGSAHKRNSLANTLGICQFLDYDDELKLELLNAATGWDMTLQELDDAYERGITMARQFNIREGWTTADDAMPWRIHQPMAMGPMSDQVLTEEQVRGETQDYYESRGWDRESGLPQADTVERLGLHA